MSRYRKVDPRIWNDAKFGALTDDGKLAFFMLLTHPNMTALGAMRATLAGLAEELGWPAERFREAFAQVLSSGMVEHDPRACFIGLPKFLAYNRPESPNVVKAWAGSRDLLPECDHKLRLIARCRMFAVELGESFANAFVEVFGKDMPESGAGAGAGTVAGADIGKAADAGSAGAPPTGFANVNEELWKAGKDLLAQQGASAVQAGSFIGLLLSDYGEAATLEAIRVAVDKQPQGAKAYLKATAKRIHAEAGKPRKQAHAGFGDMDYSRGLQ